MTSASLKLAGVSGVSNYMEEGLIKRLMASIKCSSCGQHYEVYDMDIIGRKEDMWFLRVQCSSCHTQSLVAAIIKESRIPEVVNDLTETELDKLTNWVSADDVLDMHNFLKGFDGDFSHLFGRE